ncbi:MAG TPA: homoprotocatechuate degradation operon regulator HpaR, partial [Paracoccaceae bacterium]|nr:homoprotocatechuate degradation operon regulator HpaR [Paracoccaceae bacterium]
MSHPRPYDRALPIALLRAREATMRLFKPHITAQALTLPQWRVIRALAEAGQLDATELSDRCA